MCQRGELQRDPESRKIPLKIWKINIQKIGKPKILPCTAVPRSYKQYRFCILFLYRCKRSFRMNLSTTYLRQLFYQFQSCLALIIFIIRILCLGHHLGTFKSRTPHAPTMLLLLKPSRSWFWKKKTLKVDLDAWNVKLWYRDLLLIQLLRVSSLKIRG